MNTTCAPQRQPRCRRPIWFSGWAEDLTPWMEGAIETLADGATVTTLLESDGTELLDFRESALFEAHEHGDEDDHGHDEHAEDNDHDDHDHSDEHAHDDDHDHDDHDHEAHAEEKDHDEHEHDEEHAGESEHDHDEHAKEDDHDHDEHAEHDDHDHDAHGHGEHDPHAWLSPANAETWLNLIAAQLSSADPDNAGTYFANAAAAREQMDALSAEVAEMLEPVRGGQLHRIPRRLPVL